jgi:hypothetical protein
MSRVGRLFHRDRGQALGAYTLRSQLQPQGQQLGPTAHAHRSGAPAATICLCGIGQAGEAASLFQIGWVPAPPIARQAAFALVLCLVIPLVCAVGGTLWGRGMQVRGSTMRVNVGVAACRRGPPQEVARATRRPAPGSESGVRGWTISVQSARSPSSKAHCSAVYVAAGPSAARCGSPRGDALGRASSLTGMQPVLGGHFVSSFQ